MFDHLPAGMHIQVMSQWRSSSNVIPVHFNISLRSFDILKSAYVLFLLLYSIELLLFSTLSYPKKRKHQIQFNCLSFPATKQAFWEIYQSTIFDTTPCTAPQEFHPRHPELAISSQKNELPTIMFGVPCLKSN